MKQCRYFIPGLALSLVAGYALALFVPIRSLSQMLTVDTKYMKEEPVDETPVQENDPYIEGLVKELNAEEFSAS